MTPFAFEFLDRMIYNPKYVIKARFRSFKEILNRPMKNRPSLVYADVNGNIFDWPALEMAGASANE